MAAVLAVVCVVQVRYRYEDEPGTIGICQCDRCQRQSGSAFLIGVIFPKEAATIATIRADGTGRGEPDFPLRAAVERPAGARRSRHSAFVSVRLRGLWRIEVRGVDHCGPRC